MEKIESGKVLSYKKEIESSKRSNSNAILWLKKERGSILKAEDIYSDLESLLVNFESIVETYEKVEGGRLKK